MFWAHSLLIIASLANLGVGLIVLLRNSRSILNRLFFGQAFSITIWSITNVLYQQVSGELKYSIALASYAAAAFIVLFFLLFCLKLSDAKIKSWQQSVLIGMGCITAIFSAIPGVVAVTIVDNTIITNAFSLILYGLIIITYLLAGVIALWRAVGTHRGASRARIRIIIASFSSSAFLGVILNLVLPMLGNYSYVQFGPVFSLLLVGGTAYAIVRHRLFDIRLVVARFVAYVLSLVTIAAVYSLLAFALAAGLLQGEPQTSLTREMVYIFLALVLATTFGPMKNFFDKISKAIFYQDMYETQQVLDRLANILVSTNAVQKLAHDALAILQKSIKADYIAIYLISSKQVNERHFSVGRLPKNQDTGKLLTEIAHYNDIIIVQDDLAAQTSHLYRLMHQENIGIIARIETSKELIGYIVFGYKSSGNIYTNQDINLIRIASDELAVAVQNALRFEEIAHFNETLQAEVDEATKQLRESNKKLRALDEAKDEFISMASHQLRTPLTSVKGYVSMVLEGDAGALNTDQRKLLQEAYASAQRMVYMIADFLNISRLKTGKFLLEPSTVSLPDLIHEEVSQLTAAAKARGITIRTHVPVDFLVMQLDETKIRQVIMNFIDNAIFYSNSGGDILITLSENDKQVILTVEDNGIGVPPKEQASLFTKFFRASNARQVRPDGTGIGLFMAKMVIAAHGGEMIFESQEHKGSVFGFKLPLTSKFKKRVETTRTKARQQ